MTHATRSSDVGSVLGERYELTRRLAGDATTDVYEGLDRVLERPVAVKVHRGCAPADRERFDAEVATLLEDPRVQVYDAGEWADDGGYVVVELADEPTLLPLLGVALPPIVVGDRAVDGDAPTEVVAIGGDTSVMPAILLPAPTPEAAPADSTAGVGAFRSSWALWAAVAAIALIAVLTFGQAGGGLDVPTPTTEPVSVTSQPPPTTAPPTTAEPVDERPGKGKGRHKGDD